jgi:hypothetical protein
VLLTLRDASSPSVAMFVRWMRSMGRRRTRSSGYSLVLSSLASSALRLGPTPASTRDDHTSARLSPRRPHPSAAVDRITSVSGVLEVQARLDGLEGAGAHANHRGICESQGSHAKRCGRRVAVAHSALPSSSESSPSALHPRCYRTRRR